MLIKDCLKNTGVYSEPSEEATWFEEIYSPTTKVLSNVTK